MSDWKRTTKELPLEGLRPEMVAAIKSHVEKYNLGLILADALMCVQTDSEKAKRGPFGRAETMSTGVVVTPRWLVWAMSESRKSITVISAQLKDIIVQDYAETEFAKMIADTGIQVSGYFTDASESVSAFIGLDESAAGRKFKETVIQAVQDAKK